jgi:hypothetical protein
MCSFARRVAVISSCERLRTVACCSRCAGVSQLLPQYSDAVGEHIRWTVGLHCPHTRYASLVIPLQHGTPSRPPWHNFPILMWHLTSCQHEGWRLCDKKAGRPQAWHSSSNFCNRSQQRRKQLNSNEHHNSGHCRTAMKLQGKGQLLGIYRASRPNTEHVLGSWQHTHAWRTHKVSIITQIVLY